MKLKLPLIAAFVATLSLSACGGGGSDSAASASCTYTITVDPSLKITDNTVGSGATVAACSKVTLTYTGWLYDATKTDHKGTQFDSGSFSYVLGSGQLIPGFEQALYNMKQGGTRTVEIPSKLGYGAAGSPPKIPANADLVFQITMNSVQ
jgi:FKBP-type peptidyl-prolyl cis-trans isomerase FkpA